jgi:thiamine-monophosphate kinase
VSLGEFELIDRLLRPLAAGLPGALGLGDDAAVIDPPEGCSLVLAKDAMVADVHFLASDPAELVAGKLLRVNLSDLAAMGATPMAYLLAIARPATIDDRWLRGFARGLARDQERFALHLAGGDTVSTPGPLVLSLTILGTVAKGRYLSRRGARPDDRVYVSGTLGDAACGLRVLTGLAATDEIALPLIDRYRTPQPRLELGRALIGLATAAIDISDGLLADLGHILAQSGVGAELEAARLPLSPAARSLPGALAAALTGGDDYELLFTAPPAAAAAIDALAQRLGLAITAIGRITGKTGLTVRDASGAPLRLERPGWRHF